ncbi:MAG: class I SAM-dependent methyltransferase [Bryobacteraceae bacterium]
MGTRVPLPKPAARETPVPEPGAAAYARHSHGLEQFFAQIQGQGSLRILDVGGVTQANVAFITGLGHKLYSEDFLRALDSAAGPEPAAALLQQTLGFPPGAFDGVLLWDVLEFLPQPLLKATVERLYQVTKPGSCMLAFFHADEKAASVPAYSYRISDGRTLLLANKQMRRPAQLFNNRAVERLFQDFQSVKFFLTRDHLREVIVRR